MSVITVPLSLSMIKLHALILTIRQHTKNAKEGLVKPVLD